MKVFAWLAICLWVLAAPFVAQADNAFLSAHLDTERDSSVAAGGLLVRDRGIDAAVDTLVRLVEAHPEDAVLLTRLGHAYLKVKDFDAAGQAFGRARKLDPGLPDACVGQGLVYVERPARGMAAYYNFRRAVGAAKQAIRIDSTYAPAYRLLGTIYARFDEDYDKAVEYFTRYLDLVPGNLDGLYPFGLACVQTGQYERIDHYITPRIDVQPHQIDLLPLVAQAHFFQERYEGALEVFERYLQKLDGAERQLYTDISLIASQKEIQDYRATSGDARIAYLEQFWARRDPDILSSINERIIEHYRRVWYARTFFSYNAHPWDRRGEVYIRYGEPDHRSRSTRRHFTQSSAVEVVRNRMAATLYGPEAAYLTFTGPIFPVRARRSASAAVRFGEDRSEPGAEDLEADISTARGEGVEGEELPTSVFAGSDAANPANIHSNPQVGVLEGKLNFGGYMPVTLGNENATVPWETWTYTQIGGGLEITFTDERGTGQFDFAPIPPPNLDANLKQLSLLSKFAPTLVYENTIATAPDHYRPFFQHPHLDFYYDLAGFRGQDGRTVLEIYYALPGEQIELVEKADSAYAYVRCAVALADGNFTEIHRTAIKQIYGVATGFDRQKGAFLPEILRLNVPPGHYELQVQAKDLTSDRTGIYRQSVDVPDYGDERLLLSDILLAASIGEAGSMEKFQKGDIWVVPMPTRTFGKGQKIYIYYEIYNLKRDEFGRTRYKAQYRVRPVSEKSIGDLSVLLSGLSTLLKSRKPQVSIDYEQVGSGREVETAYFELDLTKTKMGIKALEVTVTDLVSDQSEIREINFSYGQGR